MHKLNSLDRAERVHWPQKRGQPHSYLRQKNNKRIAVNVGKGKYLLGKMTPDAYITLDNGKNISRKYINDGKVFHTSYMKENPEVVALTKENDDLYKVSPYKVSPSYRIAVEAGKGQYFLGMLNPNKSITFDDKQHFRRENALSLIHEKLVYHINHNNKDQNLVKLNKKKLKILKLNNLN